MPAIEKLHALLSGPAADALGYALLHFLWQGLLIALLLWLLLKLLEGRSAGLRYAASCMALAAMLVVPVWTWVSLSDDAAFDPALFHTPGEAETPHRLLEEPSARAGSETAPPEVASPVLLRPLVLAEPYLRYLVVIWGAGVLLLFVRLLGGWSYARHMTLRSSTPAPATWQRQLGALRDRLHVARPVRLLVSAAAGTPYVFGWLRPIIVVPGSLLTGLPPWQVEALLAHELAHIRRHDVLVNLLQSIVETLLFYHPAVWWVSRQIRIEREHCCDDEAAQTCGDVLAYARALVELEELRIRPQPWALAANEGGLHSRIRRLLSPSPPRGTDSTVASLSAAVIALFCMSALVVSCSELTLREAPDLGSGGVTAAVELPPELAVMLRRGDEAALIEALHALRESDTERALPVILAAYREASNAEVRSSIVHVLSHCFTPEADERLGRIAREDPSSRVRYSAVWAFTFRLSGLGLKNPGELTLEDLRIAEATRRRNLPRNRPMFPLFREIALDEQEEARVRSAALRALRDSGYEDRSFFEAVYHRSSDPEVKQSALRELGRLGEAAFPFLAQVLEAESNPEVHRSAVWALGQTGHPSAVPLLVDVARTAQEKEDQWTAMRALWSLSSEQVAGAEAALQALLRSGMRLEVL